MATPDGSVLTWIASGNLWEPRPAASGPTGPAGATGPAGGGGWNDATTLGPNGTFDFTAQTTTTFATDGTYHFGGFTWTKQNSTGDQVAMNSTNGTGLVIVPVSATQYNGGTWTAPLFMLPIVTAIPGWYPTMPIRLWVSWASQNAAANFDEVFIGIDTGSAMRLSWRHGIGHDSAMAWASVATLNGTSTGQLNSATSLSDLCMMVEYPDGVPQVKATTLTSSSNFSAGTWPDASTFLPRCMNSGSNIAAQGYAVNGAWPALGSWFIAIGAQRQGSGTALSATVKAIRVQYRS